MHPGNESLNTVMHPINTIIPTIAKTVPAITQGFLFHSRQFSEIKKHLMNQIQPPCKINTIKMRVLLVEKPPKSAFKLFLD